MPISPVNAHHMTNDQLNNWEPSQRQLQLRCARLRELSTTMLCKDCRDAWFARIDAGTDQPPKPIKLTREVAVSCQEDVYVPCTGQGCRVFVKTTISF